MLAIKYLIFLFFFLGSALAENKKVYFYTTESNIHDFKSLKIGFESYLQEFGNFEFQAFTHKETFENYMKNEDCIVILSSWHYKQLAMKYKLKPSMVAFKHKSITTTKVLVGKKGLDFEGKVTTAYSLLHGKKVIDDFISSHDMNIQLVPKEIDALMSVGFGLSQFALVSKDSFEFLKQSNAFLSNQLHVYKESLPNFRMLVAIKSQRNQLQKFLDLFTLMPSSLEGQKLLKMIGIDKLVVLTPNELNQLGGDQ